MLNQSILDNDIHIISMFHIYIGTIQISQITSLNFNGHSLILEFSSHLIEISKFLHLK